MGKTYEEWYQENQELIKTKTHHNSGGIGEYYLLLNKQEIREKANYTCQRCGSVKKAQALHIHHIIPSEILGKRNDESDNLICLCNSCHQQLHALIKDVTDVDEIKRITDEFIRGELMSYKERAEYVRTCQQVRQQRINFLRQSILESKLKIKGWKLNLNDDIRKIKEDYNYALDKQVLQEMIGKEKEVLKMKQEKLDYLLKMKHEKPELNTEYWTDLS